MKKLLALLLCVCMVLAFAGCSKTEAPAASASDNTASTDTAKADDSASDDAAAEAPAASESMVYTDLYVSEVTTLNYLIASQAWDQESAANTVDSLVENDQYGNIIPGLAESWENSDDGLTWTFHLRKGVKWYDYQGNEIAELTANDFVAAAKYVMTSENESLTFDQIACVKNARAYYNKEVTDFAEVGVSAPDDYTLVYTLEQATPYFLSGLTYTCWFPAYGPQLEELGTSFGTDIDKIYFCGAYILSEFEPQGHHKYVKNENNWDADRIYITEINRIYNAEAETLAPQMVLRGEADACSITTDIVDDWKANYADYLSKERSDVMWSYFYTFNFNPTYDESYAPADWSIAVNNSNFRHSIMSAFNRAYSITAYEPDDPESIMQQTITPATFCNDGTTDFAAQSVFADNAKLFYNEATALEYKAKAVEELTAAGVTFPIQVIIGYKSGDTDWENECILVKQQLEGVLGTDYINCVLWAGPSENFLAETRKAGKYSIMRCNWGADYIDPQTWTDPFDGKDNINEETGKCIGNTYNRMDSYLWDEDKAATAPETAAALKEYYDKVAAAKAEVTNMPARYAAFAAAEDVLLENAFVIPYYTSPSSYRATKINIFDGQYCPSGVSNYRFKWLKVADHYITMDEFEANQAAWMEGFAK